eukprot:5168361-Pyramimonas_sp.AAC.1
MFLLSTKFENLDEERQLNSGAALSLTSESMRENGSTRLWCASRSPPYEAAGAGFNTHNFQIRAVILFRALGVGTSSAQQLLQPLNHHMPREQQ